jgi:YD repeat-containing protein
MLGSANSPNGVPVRLTYERWGHIVEAHDYMAGLHDWVLETVAEPEVIASGWTGSLIATRHFSPTPISDKHLVVVYREVDRDNGFVITAFLTSKIEKVWKRGILWQRSN